MCSVALHWAGPKTAVAVAGCPAAEVSDECDRKDQFSTRFALNDFSSIQRDFEIVGPQHLAAFLRSAFTCSDAHFPWRYHVTELLPAGATLPPSDSLHPNESPPTFILPDVDGTYTVLAQHPSGITVCAATLTHRVFCLGYALTEPQRPGK